MKKWKLNRDFDEEVARNLQQELNIPFVVANILAQRGISTFDDAKRFFRPTSSDFHDPFIMYGMNEAVDRLIKAINEREKILVYGDYDVDGSCSVALMFLLLKKLKAKVYYYQPDRYNEGYGISLKGIELAIKEKAELMIALDCGVKAVEQSKILAANKIDLIICDHHLPGDEIPTSIALLNPKQDKCKYPFKHLCGCGIGFKLAHGLIVKMNLHEREAFEYLDLVAIATAADIVPMIGENRVITKLGLQKINEKPRLGVREMISLSKRSGLIETADLIFVIAPRINAAGRLQHASIAVELLINNAKEQVISKANQIEDLNAQRKKIDKQITNEALAILADQPKDKFTSVVYQPHWHKGVVGIVASRLTETYYRPTIVLCKDGDLITGSVRSVKGFDIYEILVGIEDLFIKFGGHQYAAGLTISADRLEELKERFENAVKHKIGKDQFFQELNIDGVISTEDLLRDKKKESYPKLFRLIEEFAPFGPGNMRPIFMMENVVDAGKSRVVGENHLKIHVRQKEKSHIYDGIGFNIGHLHHYLDDGKVVLIAFGLAKNEYMNSQSLQLNLKDIKHQDELGLNV